MNFPGVDKRSVVLALLVLMGISAAFIARSHFQAEAEKRFVEFVKPSTDAFSRSIDVFCDIVESNNKAKIDLLKGYRGEIDRNFGLLSGVDGGLYIVQSKQYMQLCKRLINAQIDYASAVVEISSFADSSMKDGSAVMRDGSAVQKAAFIMAFSLKSSFELKDAVAKRDKSAAQLHEEADRLIRLINSVDSVENRRNIVNEDDVKKIYRDKQAS